MDFFGDFNSIDSNSVQNSRTIEGNTELEVVQEITDSKL